jgi:AraC-like DNA-binding protein
VDGHEAARLSAVPTARGGISRLAYERAKAAGLDVDLLLKKSGLTQQQMNDPSVGVAVRDQIKFLNLVAEAIPDDLLGFHLALECELREIGLLYYVAATSATLDETLQRVARYSSIVNEAVSISCSNDGEIDISFGYVGIGRHLDRHQMEFVVTALVRTCRKLTDRHLVPTALRLFHHRDAVSPEFVDFFGRAAEFSAPDDALTFPASNRSLPIVSADPYLNKLLITYCEEALAQRPYKVGSFRSAVERSIVQLLPHGKARADEIARQLGVSPRTFARRLSAEGVTYTQVLDEIRAHLAPRYLADRSLSISQIAWLLGYQEVSAFTHAFKRRTGQTPREARGSP